MHDVTSVVCINNNRADIAICVACINTPFSSSIHSPHTHTHTHTHFLYRRRPQLSFREGGAFSSWSGEAIYSRAGLGFGVSEK